VPIDVKRAEQTIMEQIAGPLGRSLMETAYGIHQVANANMMRAVKGVTTYRGRDPRDFALYAFGGNGGVHGVELARSLQIPTVIVPPAAGVFSAIGLLTANVELTLAQGMLSLTREMDVDKVEQTFQALERQIAIQLGSTQNAIAFKRATDLRYTGQAFELTVPAPNRRLDSAALAELERLFEQEHEQTYGHAFRGTYATETVTLRVTGSIASGDAHGRVRTESAFRPRGTRMVYFGPAVGERETPIIARDQLGAELSVGPIIVEEYEGTTVIPPDCAARLDAWGNILIDVGQRA
jgi:N-methylhydantoinase A